MNEHDESEKDAPPILSTSAVLPARKDPKPFSYWAKRLLVCNPFYLVSAALLLFGMYRISVDGNFFREEISQLAFNLTSLEFYELLLVATALFLAARRIWYDSTLLVGLENVLVFVPFILVSQVALISTHIVWVVCAVTVVIAVLRFAGLKKYFRELNLPSRMLWLGAALLMINVGLLAAYRIVGQTKMGWKPDAGRDFEINQLTWLIILPAALALANFLPHARETGSLEPQRRWLPDLFFTLWGIATGVHLYCLNYVYNFAFDIGMAVPAVWIISWIAFRRAPEILGWESDAVRWVLAVAPLLVPLMAASGDGTKIFFALAAMNTAIYAVMYFLSRDRAFVRHLLFASVVLMVCGLPAEWIHALPFDRETLVGIGAAVYLLLYAVLSRDPKLGVLGSLLVGFIVGAVLSRHANANYWAAQSGVVFLLLHSFFWREEEHQGARAVRVLAGMIWIADTIGWVHADAALWMPCVPGGMVLGACVIARLLRGRWDTFILPAASILTVLSGPGNALITILERAPMGLLAVMGSFLLFGFGTAAALTKHRWHKTSA